MTLRLFFHSDELQANVEVMECTPCESEFAVVLRATLFHPQGGGQPCDTGWIGESQVLRVVQEPERIVHFVDRAVSPGMIRIDVDESRRQLNSRLHSAGHLIGHFAEKQGWVPVKGHHWPNESRITFKPGQAPGEFDSDAVQDALVQAVDAWGLRVCAKEAKWNSDTVSAIRVPSGVDARDVIRVAYDRYNCSFGAGLGPLAAEAFERAAMKLPIKTKVVARLGDTSHLGGE